MSKSLIPLSLVPPGVDDDRQRALVQAFGEVLAELDLSKLSVVDPMTVDAKHLPYLIRSFAAQEFIDPNFPEHVQRRILARIWQLKSLMGYTGGVRLGLELLGMQMGITQWYEKQPMGPPNTHEITFLVGEALFDENAVLGPRTLSAARRMIDVTKRWSQESSVRVGVNLSDGISIAPAVRSLEVARASGGASRPSAFSKPLRLAAATTAISVVRKGVTATRPTSFAKCIKMVATAQVLQINRVSAKAA